VAHEPYRSSILPTGARSRLIEGVNGITVHLLGAGLEDGQRPLLLVLDDLHWADRGSLAHCSSGGSGNAAGRASPRSHNRSASTEKLGETVMNPPRSPTRGTYAATPRAQVLVREDHHSPGRTRANHVTTRVMAMTAGRSRGSRNASRD
jgi:hypothetical protein